MTSPAVILMAYGSPDRLADVAVAPFDCANPTTAAKNTPHEATPAPTQDFATARSLVFVDAPISMDRLSRVSGSQVKGKTKA